MGEFFAKFWDLITAWWPIVIVGRYEGGLILRNGKKVIELEPGAHLRIPFFDESMKCPVIPENIDLKSQVIGNRLVKFCMCYRVVDAPLALMAIQDYEDSLMNVAQGIIGSALIENENITATELKEHSLADLKIQAAEWGIEVESLEPIDFAKVRIYRMVGDEG